MSLLLSQIFHPGPNKTEDVTDTTSVAQNNDADMSGCPLCHSVAHLVQVHLIQPWSMHQLAATRVIVMCLKRTRAILILIPKCYMGLAVAVLAAAQKASPP